MPEHYFEILHFTCFIAFELVEPHESAPQVLKLFHVLVSRQGTRTGPELKSNSVHENTDVSWPHCWVMVKYREKYMVGKLLKVCLGNNSNKQIKGL